MAAPRVQKKSLDYPDETRDVGEGQMQIATVSDFKVARLLLQPGWKLVLQARKNDLYMA